VIAPWDDRWSGLHYRGHWRKLKQAGAWLDTISRGAAGTQVSVTLGAGRPIFLLRGGPGAAKVELREGAHRKVLTLARRSSSASRVLVGPARSRPGAVSLRVLQGMVDLDGVAVEA
jgi:hypothetical protein